MSQRYFQGQFLVAMPSLQDSTFERAVVYLLEHNAKGAVGLIINHALDISVDDILEQVNDDYHQQLYPQNALSGGPVETGRGFILHKTNPEKTWQGEVFMQNGISITASIDLLQALAKNQEIGDFLLVLGYSGWTEGQLEKEIAENAWLVVDTDATVIFALPVQKRLNGVLESLGIEYQQLSSNVGRA